MLKNRLLFNRIFVALSEHYEKPNISNWLKPHLSESGIVVLDPQDRRGQDDWRDKALKNVWDKLDGEWIWFTEQDFLFRDESFLDKIDEFIKYNDYIYYSEKDRVHPACLFVRKEIAERCHKDFAANPGVYDHFGRFTQELASLTSKSSSLTDIGLEEGFDFLHMTGLTHNYDRARQLLPPTRPDEFVTYNRECLKLPVDQCDDFAGIMRGIVRSLEYVYDSEIIKSFFERR